MIDPKIMIPPTDIQHLSSEMIFFLNDTRSKLKSVWR